MSKFKWPVLVLLLIASAYFFLGSISFNGEYSTVIIDGHSFLVEVADSPGERALGLSGRESLDEDCGLLFVFEKPGIYGFWMKDMKFPIDIIWINGDEVVYALSDLSPSSYPSVFNSPSMADKVLEVKAGTAERLGVAGGDKVSVKSGNSL